MRTYIRHRNDSHSANIVFAENFLSLPILLVFGYIMGEEPITKVGIFRLIVAVYVCIYICIQVKSQLLR